MRKWALLLAGILTATFLVTGCKTTTATIPSPEKAVEAPKKKNIPQDPKLVISTLEVMQALSGPDKEKYLLVDARPANKFDAGHVPGAISIPKPLLPQNLDKLSKDKTIIFYCGGLHCKLSPQSAEIAIKAGFTNVKVWYEGQPGWVKAGNYSIIETKGVEKLVMKPSLKPFVLVDARPAVKYQKSFIPNAISLPKAEFDLKKGILPIDKNVPLIFYCGGYKCMLSHQSADLALKLGYKKVSVYAAGQPDWKKAKLPLWGNQASGVAKKKVSSKALPEAITAKEFRSLVAAGNVTIIDVRTAEDYAAGHIPGAINIFDEDFIFKAKESVAKLPKKGRVVLHCAVGGRAGGAYYAILGESDYVNKNNLQYLDATIDINADGSFEISTGD